MTANLFQNTLITSIHRNDFSASKALSFSQFESLNFVQFWEILFLEDFEKKYKFGPIPV